MSGPDDNPESALREGHERSEGDQQRRRLRARMSEFGYNVLVQATGTVLGGAVIAGAAGLAGLLKLPPVAWFLIGARVAILLATGAYIVLGDQPSPEQRISNMQTQLDLAMRRSRGDRQNDSPGVGE